jgi:hypothetical protein
MRWTSQAVPHVICLAPGAFVRRDEEVNLMIIKAITSGATTVPKAADSMGVTEASLAMYCEREVRLGRASWMALKTMYKPQKPGKHTNPKKRKKKQAAQAQTHGGRWPSTWRTRAGFCPCDIPRDQIYTRQLISGLLILMDGQ